jgi:hypothetical protein
MMSRQVSKTAALRHILRIGSDKNLEGGTRMFQILLQNVFSFEIFFGKLGRGQSKHHIKARSGPSSKFFSYRLFCHFLHLLLSSN